MCENKIITIIISAALAGAMAACAGTTSTNTSSDTAGTRNVANANPSPTADPSPVVNTSEPYKYRATISLTAQTTGGERALTTPPLSADVARNGSFSYFSFNLPGGEPLIFLDRGQTRYVILPNRRQYAELANEAAGFDVPNLMAPGQVVSYLQKQQDYERVGEEQLNGRTVVKYASADAGAETFIYVDKNTGLPLRTELLSRAAGNGQGIEGVKIVAEMSDIRRNYDQSIFEVPEDMNKVAAEQVRQQAGAVVSAANAIAGDLLKDVSASSTTISASTAAR